MDEKRQRWQKLLEQFQESGQTITAFCHEQDLSYNQFSYWRGKLSSKNSSFVELSDRGNVPIGIEMAGVCVKVERGYDRETLLSTLHLLKTL